MDYSSAPSEEITDFASLEDLEVELGYTKIQIIDAQLLAKNKVNVC